MDDGFFNLGRVDLVLTCHTPSKSCRKSATTTIKVTGKAFGAALDAVGSDDTPETEEE